MIKKLIFFATLVLLMSCSRSNEKLSIGLIRPSTNHLPVGIAFKLGMLDENVYDVKYFSSGWEVNEAIINNKIDMAIMPFTYVWTAVSKNRDIQTISFFERESDGIIACKEINSIEGLNNRKIGVLRISTLEIFAEMLMDIYDLNFNFVYFRTPAEMAQALTTGSVDAISFYVPSIFKFDQNYKIVSWYSDYFPEHTCCDIVATKNAIKNKSELIELLLKSLELSTEIVNSKADFVLEYMSDFYNLEHEEALNTLKNTKFYMNLSKDDQTFQHKTARKMRDLGYLDSIPSKEEVYNETFFR